jgi:hypothetical protein
LFCNALLLRRGGGVRREAEKDWGAAQSDGGMGHYIAPHSDDQATTQMRLDPFERTNLPTGDKGSLSFLNWFTYEFWRFVFVQHEVAKLAQTAIEFSPMQKGASFNLDAVKEQIERAMRSHAGK